MYTKNYLTIALLFVAGLILRADIIPEDSHAVDREVTIINTSDFPDIQFVGYITGPMVPDKIFYLITDSTQLSRGYKFNSLQIFGIKKTDLETLGGIDALTADYVEAKVSASFILSAGGYYVSDHQRLEKDVVEYAIKQETDGSLTAKLHKRVLSYSKGKDKIIDY